MPRADPRRSVYCAVRHLLRNLGDASELLSNPLALELAGGQTDAEAISQAIREAVATTLAAMESDSSGLNRSRRVRHCAIMMRCDVLREPRETIARDLGLSIRQFERERRDAMARFARSLLNRSRSRQIEVTSSLARIALDHAARLADAGDEASARAILGDVAKQSADNADRVLALICKANLEASSHEADLARASLRDAKSILNGSDVGDAGVALGHACEAAGLRLSLIADGAPRAVEVARKRFAHAGSDQSVSLLVARAEVLLAHGDIGSCGRLIAAARSLANQRGDLVPGTLVDLSILEPQVRYWSGGSFSDDDIRDLERVECDATAAGYNGRAAVVSLMRLARRWKRFRTHAERRAFRAAFAECVRWQGWSKNLRLHMYHVGADVEGAIGDPWRAAEAARHALELAPNLSDAAYMKSLLCESYARGGRRTLARKMATEIAYQEHQAPWGAALNATRILSAVSFADGKQREGRRYLADSLDLARQYAPARLQARLLSATSPQ